MQCQKYNISKRVYPPQASLRCKKLRLLALSRPIFILHNVYLLDRATYTGLKARERESSAEERSWSLDTIRQLHAEAHC